MKRFFYRLFRLVYGAQKWLTRRFTTSGLAVLVSLLVLTAVLNSNQALAYQIFTFLMAVLGIAIAASLRFRPCFSATRILPRFGTAGTKLKYRIILQSKASYLQFELKLFENFADPRPSFQEFLETPEPDEVTRNPVDRAFGYYRWLWLVAQNQRATVKAVELLPLAPKGRTEVVMELEPSHRGVVRFAGLAIARPDPFGLFNAYQTIALPQSLWILPQRYHLPPIRLPGSRRYQSGGVALASSVGDSEEFMSLRDYRPGDPLRKIHWKSWAKIGKPIVKEEQDEFFVRHALILDTFQEAKYSEILEAAVSVAASFACEFQTQESLLDLMFVGHEAYCFTTGRGVGHTDQMLEILAAVTACRDKSFEYLTPVVISRASLLSGCICILLAWDAERQKLVNALRGLRVPLLVLVIVEDPGSSDLPASDLPASEHVHVLKIGNIQAGLMQL